MGAIAAKHTDLFVGMDMHMIQPPPPAPPLLVPHPVVGMIMDPADYDPAACTVFVNGLPRARAGSMCMMSPPHVPIGGMFVKPPLSEAEVEQGSSTVTADGDALSASTHGVLGCHDIGAPAPVRAWKSGGAKSLMKAGSVIIAIPAGGLVLVGGSPTASATSNQERAKASDFIELEVVDEDGAPYEGAWLEIELPDGTERQASVPASGVVAFCGIPSGTCQVRAHTKRPRRTLPCMHRAGVDEWLGSIADDHGLVGWSSAWDAPENEALRKARKDPHALLCGDEVHVPRPAARALDSGTVHTLELARPSNPVRVRLLSRGEPIGDADAEIEYEHVGEARRCTGTTDASGVLAFEVPFAVREVHVTIAAKDIELTLEVGRAEPLADAEDKAHLPGVHARLCALGLASNVLARPRRSEDQEVSLAGAIARFQALYMNASSPTGELDPDTVRALADAADAHLSSWG